MLKNQGNFVVESQEVAFAQFQDVLRHSLKLSKHELERRIADDNLSRNADRIQRGYQKRGPKPRAK